MVVSVAHNDMLHAFRAFPRVTGDADAAAASIQAAPDDPMTGRVLEDSAVTQQTAEALPELCMGSSMHSSIAPQVACW